MGGCSVDLIGEKDLREHGAGPKFEVLQLLVEDGDPGDVGGQKVGRELDASEGAVERARQRLGQHRLADARNILDQEVALAEEGRQTHPNLTVLVDDGAANVRKDGLRHALHGIELNLTSGPAAQEIRPRTLRIIETEVVELTMMYSPKGYTASSHRVPS